MRKTSSSPSSPHPRSAHEWLIAGGCPRSGTTLLGFLLNTHPEVRVANELSIAQLLDRVRDLFYREGSVKGVIDRKKGKKENWSREDILALTPTFDACAHPVVDALFASTFGAAAGDDAATIRYFGDKLPKYYDQRFDEVQKFLPGIRVIHVSRHPLDVVNSMLRRSRNSREGTDYWRPDQTIDAALIDWIRGWNFIVPAAKRDPKHFLHVKYEDLVFTPKKELETISAFLGVENRFSTDRIVTEAHFEREQLSEVDCREIDERLSGLARHWEDPLEKLCRRAPRLATAGLEPMEAVAPPFFTRVQSRLDRLAAAWRGEGTKR